MIAGIEERIARWTLLPVGNGEGLQVGAAPAVSCLFWWAAFGVDAAAGRQGRGPAGASRWEPVALGVLLLCLPLAPIGLLLG